MFIYVDQLWEYAHKWYMYLIGECTLSNTHTHTHRRIRGEIARVKKKRKERERERGAGSHRGAAMWWHEQVKEYQTNSTSELRLRNKMNKKNSFQFKNHNSSSLRTLTTAITDVPCEAMRAFTSKYAAPIGNVIRVTPRERKNSF